MKSERDDFNMEIGTHCLLMGLDGVTYQALLDDLSPTGALIKISENVPTGLHINELCGLVLSENPNRSSSKHTGVIIKLDSDLVQISFNQQAHPHQNHTYSSQTS